MGPDEAMNPLGGGGGGRGGGGRGVSELVR